MLALTPTSRRSVLERLPSPTRRTETTSMTTTANPADRAALIECDQDFFRALVAADGARLDEPTTDDFILVGVGDGVSVTKAVLLEAVVSGAVRFPAVRSFPDEAVVRRIGDVGVIVGRTSMDFTRTDGSSFTAASRYTHVFSVRHTGGWRLLSAQGTEIKPGT
ncbi:nuclear transport factor 2 family protein [Embleya sp. NPDC050154]|uniref:nuclear transport factor 2 family protein n=1 Tax=unclassified Embleya TaxID=2699296 RepID=UPI0037B11DDB